MLLSNLDLIELWLCGALENSWLDGVIIKLDVEIMSILRAYDNPQDESNVKRAEIAIRILRSETEVKYEDLTYPDFSKTSRGSEIIAALKREHELENSEEFKVNEEN